MSGIWGFIHLLSQTVFIVATMAQICDQMIGALKMRRLRVQALIEKVEARLSIGAAKTDRRSEGPSRVADSDSFDKKPESFS
jgi:hypothetical protein